MNGRLKPRPVEHEERLIFQTLTFRWGKEARGILVRQDRRYNLLVEKAFELKTGEYGRMIYNGRHTSTYTGEWDYE